MFIFNYINKFFFNYINMFSFKNINIFKFNKYNCHNFYSSLTDWQIYISDNIVIKYKIRALSKGIIEFIFNLNNISINEIILRSIFHIITTSDIFICLENVTINLMAGINQGIWVSIGKSFILTSNTTEDQFVKHYTEALNVLKQNHYTIIDFSIISNTLIPTLEKIIK